MSLKFAMTISLNFVVKLMIFFVFHNFFGSAIIFMSLINFLISLSNTIKIVTSKSVETFLTLERKKEKKLVKAEIIEPVLEEKS